MSECVHCGATDAPENGIVVGLLGDSDENICTVCRAEELYEHTVLSRQEALVASHKQLTGASHGTIADRTELAKSTVDEYSRRMKKKVKQAARTRKELGNFL